jgi:hypothetical protein
MVFPAFAGMTAMEFRAFAGMTAIGLPAFAGMTATDFRAFAAMTAMEIGERVGRRGLGRDSTVSSNQDPLINIPASPRRRPGPRDFGFSSFGFGFTRRRPWQARTAFRSI